MAANRTTLAGFQLFLAGLVLGVSNFMVVLDTTIANVSVPHIAGGLGISSTQGTWVITSYAVAEAITVPLTGWLAQRFGTVRTFAVAMAGFALFSMLCGLSGSLATLVLFRIGQGLCGGPLMPLSQTLLLQIFPKEKHAAAMGMWAMTTVVAPIAGPILGGYISDNWSWPWIFFINLPIAAVCVFGVVRLLARVETPTVKRSIDVIGLLLLILSVGALQIMLDIGREHDWFSSGLVVGLAIVAAISFAVFLAWELTEDHPVVDLRVMRHRGFAVAVSALSFAFAAFFASVVIIPQWLQSSLGYTATEAGHVTAFTGVFAVIMSPIVARLSTKVDPRGLVCFGILWLGVTSLLRTQWNTGADFWTLALPQLAQGFGMPFFFVPLTTLALGAVRPEETASAAGLMNFMRTMSGAIGTSIATTAWDDYARVDRSELVGLLNQPDQVMQTLQQQGFTAEQARGQIERLVELQSISLSTNHIFMVAAVVFVAAAMVIWLAPRPKGPVDTSAAH
ncbi:DHA2 family efflux MFS transporter permease subunit [Oleisolibacter albus]|uniref:DHA2 family efflux MFS transporter permease subunit n=1 Tax=Oleisolibacter albus TaxID=2171757 RepID=UPI000DF3BCE2|nr:DHA2 family efflux MFS transporter permease subunit [Oleisolibacter albus]